MSVTVLHGNALALPLADDSVDLVVTSPPYWALRSYTDGGEHYEGQIGSEPSPSGFVDALIAATREMQRVVKPSGSIFVNLGDKYAGNANDGSSAHRAGSRRGDATMGVSTVGHGVPRKSLMGLPWRYAIRCIDDLGLTLRAEMIWDKPNGLPERVRDRVRRSHETWFHFTLGPSYYADLDEIRVPHTGGSHTARRDKGVSPRNLRIAEHGDHGLRTSNTDPSMFDPRGKLPGSVWKVQSEPLNVPDHLGVDHFAAFPTEWARRLIQGWCPPGGVVLDPFGGTGTVALVADVLGCHGVSVDMSRDYCRLAGWRTADPRQRAKAARLEYTPPVEQLPGQMALAFA